MSLDHDDFDGPISDLSPIAREKLRTRVVHDNLWLGAELEETAKKLRNGYSLRKTLLEEVTGAAMDHALLVGSDTERFEYDIAAGGIRVVNDLQYSLVKSHDNEPQSEWNFWKHEHDPLHLIRAGQSPYMWRDGVLDAASGYLELPYRAPRLERTLADVLVALELYAFGDEMLRPVPRYLRWLVQSPLQQKHVLRSYLGGILWNGLIFLGGAYLAATYLPTLAGETAAAWVAGISAALFVLLTLLSTIALPFAWRHQAKAREKVWKMIELMLATYTSLDDGGTVSSRRVREVAAKAADAGVVWPGPLFAILDDNIGRSGLL
jgi:hypothetical protein